MPIKTLELQRKLAEVGRIRMGESQPIQGKSGRKPVKLDNFRLTSYDKPLVEQAAAQYGGEVTEWTEEQGSPLGTQYQVHITAEEVPILVPPNHSQDPNNPSQYLTQWYELWSGGGCKRRCDGETETLQMKQCICAWDVSRKQEVEFPEALALLESNPDLRQCKATTRLSVMLPELSDMGVWRLESHGYYAAIELAASMDILQMASDRGRPIPATLRVVERMQKRDGKTQRFMVPRISIKYRMADALGEGAFRPAAAIEAPAEGRRATQRVALGEPEKLPDDKPMDAQPKSTAPDLGPRPPLPGKGYEHWPAPPPPEKPSGPDTAERPALRNDPPADAEQPAKLPPEAYKKFAIQCREAGFTDEQRHDWIEQLTYGRTRSSKDLTPEEMETARTHLSNVVRDFTLRLIPLETDNGKAAEIYSLCPDLPRGKKLNLDQWLIAYKAVKAEYPPPEAMDDEATQAPLEGEVVTEGAGE